MASQSAVLDSRLPPRVQLPRLCSTRIGMSGRSIAMVVPQPPLQPLSLSSSSSASGRRSWNFPTTTRRPNIAVKSSHLSLVSPHDHLSNLAFLFSAGALGIWFEETKIGRVLSGALVATLLGLAANNLGIIASDASSFPIVMDYLLPLAVPMLLFKADLHCVLQPTPKLFEAFFLGSVGTIIGSLAAHLSISMKAIGREVFKGMARRKSHFVIGNGVYSGKSYWGKDPNVNYFDMCNIFYESVSIFSLGFGTNNIIRAVYLAILCALASRILPETTTVNKGMDGEIEYNNKKKLSTLQFVTSLAVSFSICKVGSYLSKYLGIRGTILPVVTVVSVVLATIFPKPFAWLAPSGEAMAMILMQVFFVVMGARENIGSALQTRHILMYSLVEISIQLAITIGIGKLLRYDMKSLVIASNALVGDPSTACVIATTKGWSSMIIPGVVTGFLGIPIGTFLTTWLDMLYSKYRFFHKSFWTWTPY